MTSLERALTGGTAFKVRAETSASERAVVAKSPPQHRVKAEKSPKKQGVKKAIIPKRGGERGMAKQSITGADIQGYLEGALRRTSNCADVIITEVYEAETKAANWNATCATKSGNPIPADCQRAFEAAVSLLQQQYDLLVLSDSN